MTKVCFHMKNKNNLNPRALNSTTLSTWRGGGGAFQYSLHFRFLHLNVLRALLESEFIKRTKNIYIETWHQHKQFLNTNVFGNLKSTSILSCMTFFYVRNHYMMCFIFKIFLKNKSYMLPRQNSFKFFMFKNETLI